MKKVLLYKTTFIVSVMIFILASVAGCTANQPQTPTPAPAPPPTPAPTEKVDISKYMPMDIGYLWEYEGEGNEYASYTLRVEYKEDNRYQLTRDNGGTVIADVYEVREDSIVHVYQEGESYDHTNILKNADNLADTIIKLPIQVGNKWISEENSYEITDIEAVVTVPYGTFKDCTVIKRTYKDGSEDYLYYKEDVGLVQSEFRTGDFKVYSRLKSFTQK